MRTKVGRAAALMLALSGLVPGPVAAADEDAVVSRLEAVLATVGRLEERLGALDRRLERLESRLADVEAFLQRIDERTARPARTASEPAAPGPTTGGAGDATPAAAPTAATAAGSPAATPAGTNVEVPEVILRNRRLVTVPETGDDYLVFDVEAVVRNLQRAGRVRARFHLTDRFGTSKRSMEWTTGVMRPGDRIVERDVRFRVTRSAPDDIWLRTADPREIRGRFDVVEVLYGLDRREEGLPVR